MSRVRDRVRDDFALASPQTIVNAGSFCVSGMSGIKQSLNVSHMRARVTRSIGFIPDIPERSLTHCFYCYIFSKDPGHDPGQRSGALCLIECQQRKIVSRVEHAIFARDRMAVQRQRY